MEVQCQDLQFLQYNPKQIRTMKKSHILIFFFFLLMVFQHAHGQIIECCSSGNSITSDPSLPGSLFTSSGVIDNSTWYNKEWLLADVYLSNGEIVRNKLLKYSGLLDELLWRQPETSIIIKLDKSAVRRFHFINNQGDTSVYFERLKVKQEISIDSSEIFGEEICRGKLSLYVFHTFFIERSEVSARAGVHYQNDTYAELPVYYFRFRNNKLVGMKSLNRKSLVALVPDKKDQINRYYKQNKPGKMPGKTELISLTQFLSSIVYE
jgi:hypothetical protein